MLPAEQLPVRWLAWAAGALALAGLVAATLHEEAEAVAEEAPAVVDEVQWASAPLVAKAPVPTGAQPEVMQRRAERPVMPAVAEVAAAVELERFPRPLPEDAAPEDFMRVEDVSSPDAAAAP